MVDWACGADTGPRPRRDAIWVAVWRAGRLEPATYLRNRAVALDWLSALVAAERAAGRRLLVGFDFPFGYPAGFATRITGRADPLGLWAWLASAMRAGSETIRDRAQVAVMTHALAAAQETGGLAGMLAAVPDGAPRDEEGWILGVGAEARLRAAAAAAGLATVGTPR